MKKETSMVTSVWALFIDELTNQYFLQNNLYMQNNEHEKQNTQIIKNNCSNGTMIQVWYNVLVLWYMTELNTYKKETPHSFKGQQLENKLRFVIYIRL